MKSIKCKKFGQINGIGNEISDNYYKKQKNHKISFVQLQFRNRKLNKT